MAAPLTTADAYDVPGQVNPGGSAQISVYAGPGPNVSVSARTVVELKTGEIGIVGARRVDHLDATNYGFGAVGIQYFLTTEAGLLIPDVAGLTQLNVLGNDTAGGTGVLDRIDGSTLTITVVPTHGLAVAYQDQIQYAPFVTYVGADTLSYTVANDSAQISAAAAVTLNVLDPASIPIFNPDPLALAIANNTTVTIDGYQAFPTEFEQRIQAVEVTVEPSHATVDEVGTSVTYVPVSGFGGQDSFEWRMLVNGAWTAPAIVAMQVGLAVFRPAYQPHGTQIIHPEDGTTLSGTQIHATPDAASTPYNTPVTLSPLENDLPQGGILLQSVTQARHGTLEDHGDGTFTYTPNPGFSGADLFSYTITDGIQARTATVSVMTLPPQLAVTPNYAATIGTAPVRFGCLVNDVGTSLSVSAVSNPPHGTAAIIDGGSDIQYQADPGFAGEDVFSYTITDVAARVATSIAHVTVLAPPMDVDPPSATTQPGVPITIPIFPVGANRILTNLTTPVSGQASNTIHGGGNSVIYLPQPTFAGVDNFDITVTDNYGQASVLTASINVVPTPFVLVDDNIAVFGGVAEDI